MQLQAGDRFVRKRDGTLLRVTLVLCHYAWVSDDSHPSILPEMVPHSDLLDRDLYHRGSKKLKKAA